MSGNLDKYIGHRVWIEISDLGEGEVTLDEVLMSGSALPPEGGGAFTLTPISNTTPPFLHPMNPTTEQEKQDHIYTTTITNLRAQLKILEDQSNLHYHLLLQAIQFLNTIRNTVPTDIRPAIIDLIKTFDHLPPPFHPSPAYENPRPEGHNSQG